MNQMAPTWPSEATRGMSLLIDIIDIIDMHSHKKFCEAVSESTRVHDLDSPALTCMDPRRHGGTNQRAQHHHLQSLASLAMQIISRDAHVSLCSWIVQ
jgi:hypothetical protein